MHAGLQLELRGDMAMLVHLRLPQTDVRRRVVGAGIAHDVAKPELIEFCRDVVVMFCVLGGEAELVVLLAAPHRAPDLSQRLLHGVRRKPAPVDRKKRQEVEDTGAVLDHQPAIHVGFRRLELRIEEDLAFDRLVGQPDRHVGPVLPAAEGLLEPVRENDGQATVLDEAGQQIWQQTHVDGFPSVLSVIMERAGVPCPTANPARMVRCGDTDAEAQRRHGAVDVDSIRCRDKGRGQSSVSTTWPTAAGSTHTVQSTSPGGSLSKGGVVRDSSGRSS